MDTERLINPEQQLEILENLKPKLGRLFQEMVYGQWGLHKEDVRLVDEAGFGYTGVPFYGPELLSLCPHIDIAVIESIYKGPRSTKQSHPKKIIFPYPDKPRAELTEEDTVEGQMKFKYGIYLWDLLKDQESIFRIPTIEVDMNGVPVLVPEPVEHVRVFAQETILFYRLREGEDEYKMREWFGKLKMIRDTSRKLNKSDVQEAAQEAIEKSVARWASQNWDWLVIE